MRAYRSRPIVSDVPVSSLPDHLPRWRTPAVRDLAWLIGSPPLVPQLDWPGVWQPDAAMCTDYLRQAIPWLDHIDRQPAPLLETLAHTSSTRLGHYAEALLAFWLRWPDNPLGVLRAHHLQRHGEGRTLGELDFVIAASTGGLLHLELAVKFYVGPCPLEGTVRWVGPAGQDRLDLKLDHLRQHQLTQPLPEPFTGPVQRGLWLKGRLFHRDRTWISWPAWRRLAAAQPTWQWQRARRGLGHQDAFAPLVTSKPETCDEANDGPADRAHLLIAHDGQREVWRGFVDGRKNS